jgi:hypothetical protein
MWSLCAMCLRLVWNMCYLFMLTIEYKRRFWGIKRMQYKLYTADLIKNKPTFSIYTIITIGTGHENTIIESLSSKRNLDNVCATLAILKINILWLKAEATGFLLSMYWTKIMRYALEFHTSLNKFLYSLNVKWCWITICLITYNNLLSSANHNLVEYLSIIILNYYSILVCFYYWTISSMKALTNW